MRLRLRVRGFTFEVLLNDLRCAFEQPHVGTYGDHAAAHCHIAFGIRLNRRENAARLAGRVRPFEHPRDGRLHVRMIRVAEMPVIRREIRRPDEQRIHAFDRRVLYEPGDKVGTAEVYGGATGKVPLISGRPITLFLPRGIGGKLHHWTALRRDKLSAATEDGVTPPAPAPAE